MLLASEMGPAAARSSLERMLDSIRLRDERPEGAPPALPSRPTSRGRLPSSRRPLLPVQFMAGSNALVLPSRGPASSKVSPCARMPGLESYEDGADEADASITPPGARLGWGNAATDHVLKKIAAVEDTRNRSLQGILWVQKHFRGHQARCSFQELKRGVTTLQSFVRGERARRGFEYIAKRWKAAVLIQKHVKRWIARKLFADQRKDIILLQSVIRGSLVRRHFTVLKNLEMPKPSHVKVNSDLGTNLQEMKDTKKEHPQVCPSVLAELQSRVLQAEAALRYKEEENVMLQQQLQLYETRWSEYEAKMKSMEETWQKQLTSLQMSLAAAKKSLVADDMASRPGGVDTPSDHLYFDSEDTMSVETHTPEGTPAKQPRSSDGTRHTMSVVTHTPEGTPAKQPRSSDSRSRNSDGTRNAVSHLVKEFEQRRQVFEDDAGILIEVKLGKSDSIMNPNEELRKLKVRFDTWTKYYKVRLQETKTALQKLGNSEPKSRKRWWATSCTR